MAKNPKPLPVTSAMKEAGAAVLAGSPDLPMEELVTAIYLAMADAEPGIPVYGTRLAKDEVAAATVADGGGDERKKRKP